MTCKSCNTPYTCAESALCAPKPTKQKPATWTDSPHIGGFPEIQSERRIHPVVFVTTVAVIVAAVLAVAPYFT